MTVSNPKINLNTLQLLRGIAAIAIVFFHGLIGTDIYKFVKYGNMGVHLFFVLSGFIIVYIHYFDIGDRAKIKPFVVKRFLRIFPLYWMTTLIYIVLVIPFGHRFSFEYILKSILLLPQQNMPIVGAAWTLEYEIFFYFLFCLLIFHRKMLYPVFAIWFISIVMFLISPLRENSLIINTVFNPINLEFLLGCGAALLVRKKKIRVGWVPKTAVLIGLLGITLSLTLSYIGLQGIPKVLLWGVPCAVLIFGLVELELNQKVNVPKIFVYLGDASYSIYLTHLITLLVFSKIFQKVGLLFHFVNPELFYTISSVLAVLAGCACHSFIERPLMKYFKENIIAKDKKAAGPVRTKAAM